MEEVAWESLAQVALVLESLLEVEELVLKVSVLKCECENHGVCRVESGELRCDCEEGYHGE